MDNSSEQPAGPPVAFEQRGTATLLAADRSVMDDPGALGRFGDFGGRYVPEALIPACEELEAAYREAREDPSFQRTLTQTLEVYAGRPTPVTPATRLSQELGVNLLLKREDLAHTGSHKINNVIGQALLAQRMGKRRLLAETGAGQHGVATATAGALFGLDVTVYMGEVDTQRQQLNVFRMELLGAKVVPVTSGSRTLKDACSEALRQWVSQVDEAYYCLGSVMGPHPYPWMVREFQTVIGTEARGQCAGLLRRGGGGGHAVLAGPGLGDDRRLAHVPGQQRLAEHVVDLVGAGVGQVLPLQQHPDAEPAGEPVALGHGRGPAGVAGEQAGELGPEVVRRPGPAEGLLQFHERRDERLGDVAAAELTEAAPILRFGPRRPEDDRRPPGHCVRGDTPNPGCGRHVPSSAQS